MEINNYLKQLIEISERKLELIKDLYMFSYKQNEAIKSGRFEEVTQLVEEKQRKMDIIDKLDEQFVYNAGMLKKKLSVDSFERLNDFNLPGTKELKEIVGKIQEQLKAIKALDDENTRLVKKELKETGEKINHTNTFKQVDRAYNPVTPKIPSYYFDKKK